jgi:hypothetical protein
MAKKRKRRKRKRTTIPKQLKATPKRVPKPSKGYLFPNLIRRFWAVIVAVSVLLCIAVSFLTLSPAITVTAPLPINMDDPTSTAFTVKNEGLLPIHSVSIPCAINEIRLPKPNHVEIHHTFIGYAKPPIPLLNREEQKIFGSIHSSCWFRLPLPLAGYLAKHRRSNPGPVSRAVLDFSNTYCE